jgi:hypothetical protein
MGKIGVGLGFGFWGGLCDGFGFWLWGWFWGNGFFDGWLRGDGLGGSGGGGNLRDGRRGGWDGSRRWIHCYDSGPNVGGTGDGNGGFWLGLGGR